MLPGSILLCVLAILVTLFLLWRSDKKKAAVGRRYALSLVRAISQLLTIEREFQIFLLGYIIVEICEIFTVGGFPLDSKVRGVW